MRQKLVSEGTLNKYIAFLNLLKEKGDYINSLKELVALHSINKSIIIAIKKLEIIHWVSDWNWNWSTIREADKQLALEVLNFLLELNKKEIVTPIAGLDEEIKGYIREIRDYLINNTAKQNNSTQGLKTPLLSRALNQVEQKPGTTLFSETDNKEAKKFELLKAIAPGVYNASLCFIMSNADSASIESTNEFLIEATEDLFNKFFSKK